MLTAGKKAALHKIAKIVSNLLLIVFLAVCVLLMTNMIQETKVVQTTRQLRETRMISAADSTDSDDADWSNGMLGVNPDYVGWLTIYGTGVDGPVVQGETNETYLRTDIYGNHSASGTFFMDETVDPNADGNIIIYGHMMQNETMFGSLKHYKEESYFLQNDIIRWENKDGEHYYKVLAAMAVAGSSNNTDYLNLQQWVNVLTEDESKELRETIKDRAFLFKGNVIGLDKYIFLVTCDTTQNNERLVLVGKQL